MLHDIQSPIIQKPNATMHGHGTQVYSVSPTIHLHLCLTLRTLVSGVISLYMLPSLPKEIGQ